MEKPKVRGQDRRSRYHLAHPDNIVIPQKFLFALLARKKIYAESDLVCLFKEKQIRFHKRAFCEEQKARFAE
jgi:hypothetical protein